MKGGEGRKGDVRKLTVGALSVLCLAVAYYFNFTLKTTILYSHLFYVPVVLACVWWGWRGVGIGAALAASIGLMHVASGVAASMIEGLVRGAMVVVVGAVVAALVEKRRQAEEAVRESESRLKAILDSVRAGIVIIDPETHKIVDANPTAVEMIGAPKEDITGSMCYRYICPAGEGCCPITDYGQEEDDSEHFLMNAGGEFVPILKTVVPMTLRGKRHLLESFVDITGRKEAEEKMKTALNEKVMLLQGIHQRIRDNLQIVMGLLDPRSIEDRETALNAVAESKDRIRSVALIHKSLQETRELSRIDFGRYVRSLLDALFQTYEVDANAIKLEVDVEEVIIDAGAAVPCGLIVNELVLNSLKHAFPDGRGRIRVSLREEDGRFTLTVSDDGKGFPEEMDFWEAETMGMQLVCVLAGQLGGKIELDRTEGTEFQVTF